MLPRQNRTEERQFLTFREARRPLMSHITTEASHGSSAHGQDWLPVGPVSEALGGGMPARTGAVLRDFVIRQKELES